MTAVFAPSGNMVACGGMDNMLTLYDLNNRDSQGIAKMIREIAGYEVIKSVTSAHRTNVHPYCCLGNVYSTNVM
jgi:hypothetical protein